MVTASTLENQENAIDRLTTTLFGAPGRTTPQIIEGYYAGTTGAVAAGNNYISGNWQASKDTDGMYNNASQIYMQAALPGRYFLWTVIVWVQAISGGQAVFWTKNNTSWPTTGATTAIAFANQLSTGSGTGLTQRIGEDVILAAGDKLYLMLYTATASSVAGSAAASFGNAYTRFGLRWIAPS
jgi:hypothetical protein